MFCVDNDEEGMKALSYLLKCLEARGRHHFNARDQHKNWYDGDSFSF